MPCNLENKKIEETKEGSESLHSQLQNSVANNYSSQIKHNVRRNQQFSKIKSYQSVAN